MQQEVNLNPLQMGIKQYMTPKETGDIDLVYNVRTLLIDSGIHKDAVSSFDNNKTIREASGKISTVQRLLLNRYWTVQLMSADKPSGDVRYCLLDSGDIGDWIKLFTDMVLPFVIANGLPKTL